MCIVQNKMFVRINMWIQRQDFNKNPYGCERRGNVLSIQRLHLKWLDLSDVGTFKLGATFKAGSVSTRVEVFPVEKSGAESAKHYPPGFYVVSPRLVSYERKLAYTFKPIYVSIWDSWRLLCGPRGGD